MIDTIRVLVDWKCNLTCSYCCNDQERFRKQIKSVRLDAIDWKKYKVVCISGGEPLLFPELIGKICEKIPPEHLRVLYTNGILFTPEIGLKLCEWGIDAVNVGLHVESSFDNIIKRVSASWFRNLRFHANEQYKYLANKYPANTFRFWKMDDCDRPNEERVVIDWDEKADSMVQISFYSGKSRYGRL